MAAPAAAATAATAATTTAAPATIEEVELPKAVVGRIIKDALPEGTGISKDVRTAILVAARTFIVYATAMANDIAISHNKKTISGADVIEAMDELEFPQFRESMQELLDHYRAEQRDKNEARKTAKEVKRVTASVMESLAGGGAAAAGGAARAEDDENDDMDEEPDNAAEEEEEEEEEATEEA